MVNYRRVLLPNGSFFFTVNLRNRRSTYLTDHVDLLRDSFSEVREKYPFAIDAIVILPEHLYTIWTLPQHDTNYPTRWRLLKSLFTRKLIKSGIKIYKNAKGGIQHLAKALLGTCNSR
jgi:putative transposase